MQSRHGATGINEQVKINVLALVWRFEQIHWIVYPFECGPLRCHRPSSMQLTGIMAP
jgi:hypothetical protein